MVPRLLNAANFGVAQKRERVFIVGVRSDLHAQFSFPDEEYSEDSLLHSKWVTGEYWDRHRVRKKDHESIPPSKRLRIERLASLHPAELGTKPWRTVRDCVGDLPKLREGQRSRKIDNHYLNPGARSYPGHTGSPWDEPAKTLKAGDHDVPGGEDMLRREDGSVRYFSVRESARLQAFPDWWKFEGA